MEQVRKTTHSDWRSAYRSARILKPRDYKTWIDCAEVVRAAESEAERILADALSRAVQIEREAAVQVEQVKQREREQAAAQFAAEWRDALREFGTEHQRFFQEWETKLLSLSVRIAEKILDAELEASPDKVGGLVREAMSGMHVPRRLVEVFVHSSHANSLRQQLADIKAATGHDQIQIRVDDSLTPGGCRIRTEAGEIDARRDTQLRQIERALTGRE